MLYNMFPIKDLKDIDIKQRYKSFIHFITNDNNTVLLLTDDIRYTVTFKMNNILVSLNTYNCVFTIYSFNKDNFFTLMFHNLNYDCIVNYRKLINDSISDTSINDYFKYMLFTLNILFTYYYINSNKDLCNFLYNFIKHRFKDDKKFYNYYKLVLNNVNTKSIHIHLKHLIKQTQDYIIDEAIMDYNSLSYFKELRDEVRTERFEYENEYKNKIIKLEEEIISNNKEIDMQLSRYKMLEEKYNKEIKDLNKEIKDLKIEVEKYKNIIEEELNMEKF